MSFGHFLNIEALDRKSVIGLFERAEFFADHPYPKSLTDKVVAHLMFEPSTRTLHSFSLAAMKLGAHVLSPNLAQSSLRKGESDLDTVQAFAAMGADVIVMRHPETGMVDRAADLLDPRGIPVINAGDGQGQHPTQALLDMLTIYRVFGDRWQHLKICIVGDIKRSRVVNSLVLGLQMMGTKEICLVAPEELSPDPHQFSHVQVCHSLEEAVQESDVVIALRIQHEREEVDSFSLQAYKNNFRINDEILQNMKPTAIVMHPGPVNHGVEITREAALSSRSQIWKQVYHGVLIRAAVLEAVCL